MLRDYVLADPALPLINSMKLNFSYGLEGLNGIVRKLDGPELARLARKSTSRAHRTVPVVSTIRSRCVGSAVPDVSVVGSRSVVDRLPCVPEVSKGYAMPQACTNF